MSCYFLIIFTFNLVHIFKRRYERNRKRLESPMKKNLSRMILMISMILLVPFYPVEEEEQEVGHVGEENVVMLMLLEL